MITDIFARRYQEVLHYNLAAAVEIGSTLEQARQIFGDIQQELRFEEQFFGNINQKLARELGLASLKERAYPPTNEMQTCLDFLSKPYQFGSAWSGGSPDGRAGLKNLNETISGVSA